MSNLRDGLHQAAGNWTWPIPLDEEAAQAQEGAKLGLGHPDTLVSMGNLATAYTYAGKLDLAIPLDEETLKLKKAELGGPNHPDTATMNNLGWAGNAAWEAGPGHPAR